MLYRACKRLISYILLKYIIAVQTNFEGARNRTFSAGDISNRVIDPWPFRQVDAASIYIPSRVGISLALKIYFIPLNGVDALSGSKV